MFVDTHSHLYDEAFTGEKDLAVERAIEAGVTRMILPDIDLATRKSMFDLASRHPDNLFPCIGLHPTSINNDWKMELDAVLSEAKSRKVWAIGEIGIDCYWSKEFLKEQQEAFIVQLELAAKSDLPVIIHSRESTEIIINTLREHRHL